MPDPYDDFLFGDDKKEKKNDENEFMDFSSPYEEDNGIEPLDEIIERNQIFREKAENFSKLLSRSRAKDHKVNIGIGRFFLAGEVKYKQSSLLGEKKYHSKLVHIFTEIISSLKELSIIHLEGIKQFNTDIDNSYYSLDKPDSEIKQEKEDVYESISMQRKILSEGSEDLQIFEDALIATENRIKSYIDSGDENNISQSEVLIITSKREELTSGKIHEFDYSFFDMNFIDKTANSLGFFMKETSSQYLNKLNKAFSARK